MGITRFRTSQELTVPHSPEVVWSVLADVAAYPDWWPARLQVKILHHSGELLGSEVEVRPIGGRRFRFRFEELEARSMRLRFFGGSLEGPGGFHLYPLKGGTRVLYEMDVFTRGLDMAALSLILSFERIHGERMLSVLQSLAVRLKAPGKGALSNFDIARLYLHALSSRATPEEIGRYFAPEATDEEFPHRFLETAVTRGFAGIVDARAGALARFGSQRYDLEGATGGGSQVAVEVRWSGSVATTGEGFTEGQELEARIAFFLKFADGRIVRQRTYACFEPWSTKAGRMLTLDERVAQAGPSMKASLPGPGSAAIAPLVSNFEITKSYLAALGARADAEAIARFYAADAVQDEFPNRLLPTGAHRDLQAIKLARSRGLALMASESYELLGATGGGSLVALEVARSGVVGEGVGLFTAGEKLEGRLGIFLKFRDGLIVAQRNYDALAIVRGRRS